MPTEADSAILNLFHRCMDEAVSARQHQTEIPSPFPGEIGVTYKDPWPIYEEFYRGDQWKRMGRMPGWKSQPVDNIGFVVVQSNTTFLCDNKPKVEYLPNHSDEYERAAVVNAGFTYWWDRDGGNITDALAVADSRKFGVGWLHLKWDAKKRQQVMECIHPENIYVDPDCTAETYFNDGPTYLIYEYMAQVGDILSAYPKADPEQLVARRNTNEGFFERIREMFGSGSSYPKNPASSVVVHELWIRDPSTVEWDEDMGDLTVSKRREKYPGGRVITIAGDQVLSDVENPYDHGLFPWAPVHCYPASDRFYSTGDLTGLLNPQVMVNRYNQLLFDTTVKSGGGIALVNKKMGLGKYDITNDPIQVREVLDVERALRFVSFPSPSRHMMDHINIIKGTADDTAGLHDYSKGRPVPGNKTANEVSMLFESDKTRVRQAARWHARAITRIGVMWLSNARQFGDFKWIVRLHGSGETVEFTPKVLKGLDLDLSVADFAQLPDRQQDRKQLALQLFSAQVIDPEELLKTLEWPNYEGVLARMQGAAQGAAQGAPQGAAPSGAPDAAGLPPEMLAMMQQQAGGPPEAQAPPQGAPELPPEMLAALMGQQEQPDEEIPAAPDLDMQPEEVDHIVEGIRDGTMTDEEVLASAERVALEEGVDLEEVMGWILQGVQP
jgi:hypothetical protein